MVVPGGRKQAVESAALLVLRDCLIQLWILCRYLDRFDVWIDIIASKVFSQISKRTVRNGRSHEWTEPWKGGVNQKNLVVKTTFSLREAPHLLSTPVSWYCQSSELLCCSYCADQTNKVSTAERMQGASWEQLGTGDISLKGMRISSISWGTLVTPRGYLDGRQY